MPVEILRKGAAKKFPTRKLKSIALKVLELLDRGEAEVSLVLVGNAEIKEVNARFRKKNVPTDVLSFPVKELPGGVSLLGDVIISIEKAKQQARERRHSQEEEMVALLIHGILHLLGYDHERSAREARIMKGMEKKIYRALCEQDLLEV